VTTYLPFIGPQFDADALCAEIDPEVWFPEQGGSNALAKALCGRCENEDACLQWALANDELFWGIFGGKSPQERRKLAARAGRRGRPAGDIPHGTEAGMKAHQRRGDVVPDHDPCGCRAASRLASAERRERRAS
jgi:hypothetical protein